MLYWMLSHLVVFMEVLPIKPEDVTIPMPLLRATPHSWNSERVRKTVNRILYIIENLNLHCQLVVLQII